MSVSSRLRVALLGILFLGLVVGRLASVLAPVAAALAPAVCRVCHGCGVPDHDDVCDCDVCHAIEEGRASAAPSVHEPAHGSLAVEPTFVTGASVFGRAMSVPARIGQVWFIPPPEAAAVRSHNPPAPLVPPPRHAA